MDPDPRQEGQGQRETEFVGSLADK